MKDLKHQILFTALLISMQLLTISCKESSSNNGTSSKIINELDFTIIDTDLNRFNYSYLNIIDNDFNTFLTTQELSLNESRFIVIDFGDIENITKIELYDNYTNSWALGDVDIYVSNNALDYELLDSILASDMEATQGFVEHNTAVTAQFIKIVMTYNGLGAYGFSPSFYLSEIVVSGEIN